MENIKRNLGFRIENENQPNLFVEFEVFFTEKSYIRGYYKKKYDNPVLLYEEEINNYLNFSDEEWIGEKLVDVYEKMIEKRESLINIHKKLSGYRTFEISDE
ncbi:MAG: hypothetical protein ACOC2W_04895 [bacterium]